MCANEAVRDLTAPGNEHRAVLFKRDCGATTATSMQLSVLGAGDRLGNDAGNAFTADDNRGRAAETVIGSPWVELRWLSPDDLLVRYDAKARVLEKDERVDGVNISYQAVKR